MRLTGSGAGGTARLRSPLLAALRDRLRSPLLAALRHRCRLNGAPQFRRPDANRKDSLYRGLRCMLGQPRSQEQECDQQTKRERENDRACRASRARARCGCRKWRLLAHRECGSRAAPRRRRARDATLGSKRQTKRGEIRVVEQERGNSNTIGDTPDSSIKSSPA